MHVWSARRIIWPTGLKRLSNLSTAKRQLPRLGSLSLVRTAANHVSNNPGSQTFGHAKQNIKEELGRSAGDVAKTISAGNFDGVDQGDPSFMEVTAAIAKAVPKPYLVFGLAGGLPYVGAAATTVYTAHQAGAAATGTLTSIDPGQAITILHSALDFQVTYGAVLLSFLGALHWGFEFAGYGGHHYYKRLALGTAPLLLAWPTLAMDPIMALITQWAGFTGLWWADLRATNAGWAPKWYSQYRFYLSILVGSCIIGSLAGTSYWGPVGGHGLVDHDLREMRVDRERMRSERLEFDGKLSSDMSEEGDAYVVLHSNKADKVEDCEEDEERQKESGENEERRKPDAKDGKNDAKEDELKHETKDGKKEDKQETNKEKPESDDEKEKTK